MKTKNKVRAVLLGSLILLALSACRLSPAEPTLTPTACPPVATLFDHESIVKQAYANGASIDKKNAYDLLTYQVQRWSDYEDIPVAAGVTYRILLTLISPDLQRAVILNEALYHGYSMKDVALVLDKFDHDQPGRGRLRFLVTVTALNQGNALPLENKKLTIAPNSLGLFDGSHALVTPVDYDGAFFTSFDVVDGPFASYIFYPLVKEDSCTPNVDLRVDTSITLKLSGLQVNGKTVTELSWNIQTTPLVDMAPPTTGPSTAPTSVVYVNPAPHSLPPTPSPSGQTVALPNSYWTAIASFVWAQMGAVATP